MSLQNRLFDRLFHKKEVQDNESKSMDTLPNEDEEERTEEEYEIVEREILPTKIICPDCGGITLEGLDFCDKCGGELH
jgi:hypothetical protein